MKKKFQLVFAIVATSLLSSCGGGGKSITEIKLFPVKSGSEFQYIDQEGKIIINPQFRDATVFREGLALVRTSGDKSKYGFITEDGKYAINPQYKEATVFSEGLAWVVSENGAPTAIDIKGESKFTLNDAEQVRLFNEGFAAFSVVNEEGDEKWGFVNKSGKVVITPQFSNASKLSDGKIAVMNDDGKWGFCDEEGKIVINYQFDRASDFWNGRSIVANDSKVGVIDNDGKYLINPQFDEMIADGDLFLINQDDQYGWCDAEGKIIINPQFRDAYPFNANKMTSVRSGDSFGYIDQEGKFVINPQFDAALPFNGKLALVLSGKKIGFIDKNGKYVVNPQFEEVADDMFYYLTFGGSKYSTVNTDFFNVAQIAEVVNVDSPEGFKMNSTFNDVMKKYELKESDFNQYLSEHLVFSNKKITNGVSYGFYVTGVAYDKITVTKGYGWYSYTDTDYKFNGKNKLTGYTYYISLSGKGYGKEEAVISAIQGKLSGYKKDESRSDEGVSVYSNGGKEIQLLYKPYEAVIIDIRSVSSNDVITSKAPETVEYSAPYEESYN